MRREQSKEEVARRKAERAFREAERIRQSEQRVVDENEVRVMEEETVELMLGRTTALDLLLRDVYTKWALVSEEPLKSNQKRLLGMIETMWSRDPPKDESQRRIYEAAEQFLQDFLYNVDSRLKEQGAAK